MEKKSEIEFELATEQMEKAIKNMDKAKVNKMSNKSMYEISFNVRDNTTGELIRPVTVSISGFSIKKIYGRNN